MQIPLTNSVEFPIFTISNNQIKETDMKLILAILILVATIFAQNNQYNDFDPTGAVEVNTTYNDGTECKCDYIVTTYTEYEADSVSGDTAFANDIMREFPFKNGKINGEVRTYHKSGELASSTHYLNGKANGIFKGYYQSGALSNEIHYVNGKEHGTWKDYYESGVVELETNYVNGKAQGINKWYYESGALNGEVLCVNNEWYGTMKSYYESGALELEIPFINGTWHGIKKWYFENGKIAGTATYKNGQLVGYKKCTDGRFGNEKLDCIK